MEDVITIAANLSTKGFEKGTKDIVRAVKSLSNTAKSFGRSMIASIVGVGSVIGILTKAIGTYMSQNEELSQRMNAIWTALGNVLGPIIEQIIEWVSTAVSYFLSFLKLLGITGKSASELSKAAKKNVQELQKTILGFDELNVLQDNTQQDKSNPLRDVEPSEFMKDLVELLKNKMWDDAADLIIQKMNDLIYAFRDKAYELGQKIGEYLGAALHIIGRVIDEVDWHALGEGLANLVNGIFEHPNMQGEDLGKILVGKFTIAFKVLTGFLENVHPAPIANYLADVIIGAFNSVADAIRGADFHKIGENIRGFFEQLWYRKDEIANAIFGALEAAWDGAINLLLGIFGDDSKVGQSIKSIGDAVKEFFGNLPDNLPNLNDNLKTLWEIVEDILSWVGECAVPAVLESLGGALKIIDSVLAGVLPLLKELWQDFLKPIATASFEGINVLLGSLGEVLSHIVKIIKGEETLKEALDSLWDYGGWNGESIEKVTEGLDGVSQKAREVAQSVKDMSQISQESLDGTVIMEGVDNFNTALDTYREGLLQYTEGLAGTSSSTEFLTNSLEALKEKYGELDASQLDAFGNQQLYNEVMNALTEISAEYLDILKQEGYVIDENGKVVHATADAVEREANAITESNEATAESVEKSEELSRTLEQVPDSADEAGEGAKTFANDTEESTEKATLSVEEMKEILDANWGDIKTAVEETMPEIARIVDENLDEMTGSFVHHAEDMADLWGEGLGGIVDLTYTWGSDLVSNFISGIDAQIPALEAELQYIASMINAYLHFTKPDKGPLADFDTYGPDMIKEFISGMEGEKSNLEKAIGDIADTISFQMPTVAGGGFLPYNVSQSSSASSGTDMTQIVERFLSALDNFEESIQNMQLVAQFGNLRLLAEGITREQRRIDRSEGR